jgi:hypothetical protein
VLISLWLLLFAAQPKEFFLDELEQRSHVELTGNMYSKHIFSIPQLVFYKAKDLSAHPSHLFCYLVFNKCITTLKSSEVIVQSRMRWAGHVARMGETRNAYRILMGKRPLGRPRWVDNIKMDLREIGLDGMDGIELAQDRDQWRALVNTVMNLRVP